MFIRSQSSELPSVNNIDCDSLVITPFGYARLSSLHFVKTNQVLELSGKDILITDSKKIELRDKNFTRKSIKTIDLNANSNLYNGWSTYVRVSSNEYSRLNISSFKQPGLSLLNHYKKQINLFIFSSVWKDIQKAVHL